MKRCPIFLIWLALWLLPPIALARMGWAIITGNIRRAWLIALTFDDLGNVVGNGSMGQTISSRAAHARAEGSRTSSNNRSRRASHHLVIKTLSKPTASGRFFYALKKRKCHVRR